MSKNKLRLYYGAAWIILMVIETYIALYVHDDFVRPYVGDMLVVIVIYCFIRIFIPVKWKMLPLYVFIFAACMEGLQYFNLPELLGLGGSRIARIVLGSVADWMDVICYGVGCLILWGYERLVKIPSEEKHF